MVAIIDKEFSNTASAYSFGIPHTASRTITT